MVQKVEPVSYGYDGHGNRWDRFEVDGAVSIVVTLNRQRCPKGVTEDSVREWYWRTVGTYEPAVTWGDAFALSPADALPDLVMDDGKALDEWEAL